MKGIKTINEYLNDDMFNIKNYDTKIKIVIKS